MGTRTMGVCKIMLDKRRRGFTLTEMAVTVGILSIVSGMAVAGWQTALQRSKETNAARLVVGKIRLLKARGLSGVVIQEETAGGTVGQDDERSGAAGYGAGTGPVAMANTPSGAGGLGLGAGPSFQAGFGGSSLGSAGFGRPDPGNTLGAGDVGGPPPPGGNDEDNHPPVPTTTTMKRTLLSWGRQEQRLPAA